MKKPRPASMDELRTRTEEALRGLERKRQETIARLFALGFPQHAEQFAGSLPPGSEGWIEIWFWFWRGTVESLPRPPHRANMDGDEEALDMEENPLPVDGAVEALMSFHQALTTFCAEMVAWTGAVTPWALQESRASAPRAPSQAN